MATAAKGGEGYNYSAIEQNQNHIKNLFKRLTDRSYRVEQALGHNRDLYARNLHQAREQHGAKRLQFAEEQERGQREGIQLGKAGARGGACKAGCGISGLDTGLKPEKKEAARAKSAQPRSKKGGQLIRPAVRSDAVEIVDRQSGKTTWNTIAKQALQYEEHKAQRDQENRDFELVYKAQREYRHKLATMKHEEKNPIIRKIFSLCPATQAEVSHIEYMSIMASPALLDRLLTLLRRQFPSEVGAYGEKGLMQLVVDCGDRRLLFKLLNGELSFDQFVVRVDCETRGVHYVCRDDLIKDRGISPHFFEEGRVRKMEAFLKSLHGVTSLKDLKPEAIVHMGSPPAADAGRIAPEDATTEYLRKLELEQSGLNEWRSNKRCLQSVFSVVSAEVQARQKLPATYKQIKFPTAARFRTTQSSGEGPKQDQQDKTCPKVISKLTHNGQTQTRGGRPRRSTTTGKPATRKEAGVKSAGEHVGDEVSQQTIGDSGAKQKASLLFIRQMLHDGIGVSYDPSQAVQMLYQGELAAHVREQELKLQVVQKKLGPREIIPGATKPKVAARGQSPALSTFDREDFRKNLHRRARSNIREARLAQKSESEADLQPSFGLAVTNKQIERNPLELLKAESNLFGRDPFKPSSKRAKRTRKTSTAVRGAGTSFIQDHMSQQEPIQNEENGGRETEESLEGRPGRLEGYGQPLASTLQLTSMLQDPRSLMSKNSGAVGSPSPQLGARRGPEATELAEAELRRSNGAPEALEHERLAPLSTFAAAVEDQEIYASDHLQTKEYEGDLAVQEEQKAFYKSKGGLCPSDIALQANENCRNSLNDYAAEFNTESEQRGASNLMQSSQQRTQSAHQSRLLAEPSPGRNHQLRTMEAHDAKAYGCAGQSFTASSFNGASAVGNTRGTTQHSSPTRTIQTRNFAAQPQSLTLGTRTQTAETPALNSYHSSIHSSFQRRRPSTGNVVGGGFKLRKALPQAVELTKKYKRAETPQRARGLASAQDIQEQKMGMTFRSGALEGVLNRLAGIQPAQLRDYQEQGLAMTPGSPWEPATPHEGEDSSLIGDTGREGGRAQNLDPKFDLSSPGRVRGVSPQRALFVKYIESLGIKVNQEGMGTPGVVALSIKDEAGARAWDGKAPHNQEGHPEFGQYSNLIINSDNQIQIVAHSTGGQPTLGNGTGDASQDLQYQIIVLQPGETEPQLQTSKAQWIDPVLTNVKTVKGSSDYVDSKKTAKIQKHRSLISAPAKASIPVKKAKGLSTIQTNEDTLRDGCGQVEEYEESQVELRIAAAKYAPSSQMLEARPISEHSRTLSQPLSPHAEAAGTHTLALETQTLNQSMERAQRVQQDFARRSTMSVGAKDALEEASAVMPAEEQFEAHFTIEAQLQGASAQNQVLFLSPGAGDADAQQENLHKILSFLKSQSNEGQIKSIMEAGFKANTNGGPMMNTQSPANGRLLVGNLGSYSPFTQSILSGKKYNNPTTVGDHLRVNTEVLKLDTMKLDTIMERAQDAGLNSLEVTPKSGIVTQITESKLTSKPKESRVQSKNQSSLPDSGQGTPVQQPIIDYHRNQVTSKIYREAYIGRSKKENIKSLALHKKHQLKEQEYAKQMLQQVMVQADSVDNITLENKSAQNKRPNQSSVDGRSSILQIAHQNLGEATLSNSSLAKMVCEQGTNGMRARPASSQPRVKQTMAYKRKSPALVDLIYKERLQNNDLAEIDIHLSNDKHQQPYTKISTLGQNSRARTNDIQSLNGDAGEPPVQTVNSGDINVTSGEIKVVLPAAMHNQEIASGKNVEEIMSLIEPDIQS